eukprot:Protomagalhaensia_sp_Gyna_25__2935@NODE_2721_length_926_cov_609_153326_g2269_i0_p1_GENE_NODE_2721_length_926_cov_609_153326_g2269_i0NODE_2721_length_926_cov_609_153326_g2269_i0_p1_ORF_typecomplete_len221_score36_84BAR/PF03114_18/3_4e07CorA/PF01544_18/0_065DUF1712/PF08217_11/96DUF1712/PF08217_11/2_3Vps5/PF09325_10/0_13Phage_HK97_TLTM/PF06120_11/0_19_NODE_2721_length_926_cov_609_153326_g2269_i0127789
MGIRDSLRAAVSVHGPSAIAQDPLGDGRRLVFAYNSMLDVLKSDISESLRVYAGFNLKDKTAQHMKEAANGSREACTESLESAVRQYVLFTKSCSGSYDSLLKPQLVRLEGKVLEQLTHCSAAISKIERRDRLHQKMLECKGDLEKSRTTKKNVDKSEQYYHKAESDYESATTEVEGLINAIVAMHKTFLRDSYETLFEAQKNFLSMAQGEIVKIPHISA